MVPLVSGLDGISQAIKDRLIIGLIGALVGTGIGTGAGFFRVDKFTGTEGDRLDRRITDIEKQLNQLPPDWLKADVVRNTICTAIR